MDHPWEGRRWCRATAAGGATELVCISDHSDSAQEKLGNWMVVFMTANGDATFEQVGAAVGCVETVDYTFSR